jgi:uncharacterized membrane protein YfcA
MMTGNKLFPFLLWLLVFYVVWTSLIIFGDHWKETLEHWPIALAMSLGSYVAGSTPMGGGTIGFPVLVLLFDMPGALGRNFGLAIQSIGMVSASIYILSLRKSVAWGLLKPALIGSLIGTPLGAVFVAPFVPDIWIKLTFAIVWASFGIMHILKMRELVSAQGQNRKWYGRRFPIGFIIGILGGIVASITGVGIDMIVYATLVLLYRTDLKIAIPTSVILMAFTSVVGIFTNIALSCVNPTLYKIDPEVYANWLAAAPVVALGAPLGAYIVSLISRTPTLILVSLLCVAQFFWTIIEEGVSGLALLGAIFAVLFCIAIFQFLYWLGKAD